MTKKKTKKVRAKASSKSKMGRPTTFDERLIAPVLALAEHGATDEAMAKALGVSVRTFYRWKEAHPDFCHALKAHKDLADDLMEESLYENGMAGNVTAQIFWLKNRRPDRWRDTRSHELTGKDGGAIKAEVTGSAVDDAVRKALDDASKAPPTEEF